MRNYHRLLFIALLVSCSFCAFDAGADTHTAATCSLADVTSAYNASSDGDIVAVPSGNCTWNGTLTVTKLITIQGAGSNQTTIAAGSVSYPSPLIALVPHADGNQRVTP